MSWGGCTVGSHLQFHVEYICKLLSLKIGASRTHLGIKKTQETTKDCYCSAVLCRVTNGNCYLGQGQLACTRAFCSNDICSWYICPLLLSRNSLFFIMFINQSKFGLCCLTLQMGIIYVYDVPLEISQSDCLWPLIFQFSFVVFFFFFSCLKNCTVENLCRAYKPILLSVPDEVTHSNTCHQGFS